MKVLITGKDGQVGKSLVNTLKTNPEITLLALNRTELDITNTEAVHSAVKEFRPNVIINAAAYTAVDKAESDEALAYAINCNGPRNIARAANEINATIIHISTDYVFSGDKAGLYTEEDIVEPQGVYGKSKLAGELAVAEECHSHIILRTAWVFSRFGNNFVKTMLRLAEAKDTIDVVSDQFGGPTFAGDIAQAIIQIVKSISINNTNFGIYNYSGFPHVSWQQFAIKVFEVALEKQLIESEITVNGITTAEYPTPAIRPANSKLDCTKIYQSFSVMPSNWVLALSNIEQYK